jgi:hypothetical protein
LRTKRKPSKSTRDRLLNSENRPASPPAAQPGVPETLVTTVPENAAGGAGSLRSQLFTSLAVGVLLSLHYVIAARSLIQENPTVDEVVHLPAGVTYWQKGTFRLYHHNPPLVKLVAALPVVWARPETAALYQTPTWKSRDPSQATFSQYFALTNLDRYFELFQLARLVVPLFSIVGGLVVFAWSRRLYGVWGGLLSLSLWVFCPNVLAHARLITTDLGSTAAGVAATYLFWRYLQQPGWRWAAGAGIALGLAQLTKFSMLLLYAVWPFLWLVRLVLVVPGPERLARVPRALAHGSLILALSVATIDAGYFFEGVGIPLGDFEVGSRTLTRKVEPGMTRPHSANPLLDATWQFRVNCLRGTWLGRIPCPLPEHYVLGFDEQKIEAEGIPNRFWERLKADNLARERAALAAIDPGAGRGNVANALAEPESADEDKEGYAVYLNGVMRRSGWWYYYLLTLAYKVPEGTWLLVLLSFAGLLPTVRLRAGWADEIALWTVPLVVLFSMSVLTDINLGLRYVLAMFPYVFISTGKVAPWIMGMSGARKWLTGFTTALSLGLTIAATASIYPSFLAYFNWASGGPDRAPARLIDSNLDWGQDLLALRKWWQQNIPGEPLGLAYFGQINPSIFNMRREPFRWFLPPARPGTIRPMGLRPDPHLIGPAPRLKPGYYAVSATLLYGLPWRLYDPAPPSSVLQAWSPAWNAWQSDAFGYFRQFEPVKKIGHSIYVYRLSEADVARANPLIAGQ